MLTFQHPVVWADRREFADDPQIAHRGKDFPAQSTTVLPLEGRDGQNPSRTTRTCDIGAEGARWDRCGFAEASAGCSQR
jgi:hypothetical protein